MAVLIPYPLPGALGAETVPDYVTRTPSFVTLSKELRHSVKWQESAR